MKTKFIVIIFTIFGLANARADLQSIYEKKGRMEESTMVQISADQILLIQTETADQGQQLLISEVNKKKVKFKLSLPMPVPILAIRGNAVIHKDKIFIAGLSTEGGYCIFAIDILNEKINSCIEISKFAQVTSIATVTDGLLIGGSSNEDNPTLELYSYNLKFIKEYKFPTEKKGEINNIYIDKNSSLLVNFSDATSGIFSIQSGQLFSEKYHVKGGGGTFFNLQDDGIIITYRIKKEVFVEKINKSMVRQWQTKLHTIKGASTKTAQLIELNKNIIWIGANEGRLLIHEISINNGKIIKTSAHEKYSIPHNNDYVALKVNNELYIQGQSRFSDDAIINEYQSFIFSYGN